MQIDFAYSSNHIEGSRLTHDQTKYIFDTQTVGLGLGKSQDAVRVNVFLSAQDDMEAILQYFQIDYERKETTYREVIANI